MSCVSASKEGVPNNEPCEIKLKGDGPTWWGESGPNRMGYIFFTVTTEAENAIVTLDTSSGDFPDWDIVGVSTNKDWIAAPGYSCEQFPEVQLYASPGHGGKGTPVYLEFWENPADSKPSDVTICPKPPLPNE